MLEQWMTRIPHRKPMPTGRPGVRSGGAVEQRSGAVLEAPGTPQGPRHTTSSATICCYSLARPVDCPTHPRCNAILRSIFALSASIWLSQHGGPATHRATPWPIPRTIVQSQSSSSLRLFGLQSGLAPGSVSWTCCRYILADTYTSRETCRGKRRQQKKKGEMRGQHFLKEWH